MIRKIARFTVRPGEVDAARAAIVTFVEAVARHEPHTTYTAYQLKDSARDSETGGVSFIHLMTFPDADAERVHQTAAYTATFVDALYPLCEELPAFTDLLPLAGTP